MLEASRVNLSARQLALGSLISGVAIGLMAGLATTSFVAGLLMGVLGGWAPLFYVRLRGQARTRKLCEQLPEAFDVMSRAVRAGQTVSSAMQLIADDLDPPIAEEFAHCHKQQSLGLSQDLALREMARRTGVIELQMFVAALLVQQRSGGNLVELLENLSTVIRKRLLLQGKLKALTSEGRMQAVVLIVLPVLMFAALYVLNQSYAQVLLDRPRLLLATAGSAMIGAVWIMRIVRLDY
jgi:tight adherence protein B